jgi:recombination protein RecA
VKNKVRRRSSRPSSTSSTGSGISREGSLLDVGVEQGIVRKSGRWYTYEGDQLGQGKENAGRSCATTPTWPTRSRSGSRRSSASARS